MKSQGHVLKLIGMYHVFIGTVMVFNDDNWHLCWATMATVQCVWHNNISRKPFSCPRLLNSRAEWQWESFGEQPWKEIPVGTIKPCVKNEPFNNKVKHAGELLAKLSAQLSQLQIFPTFYGRLVSKIPLLRNKIYSKTWLFLLFCTVCYL